jgi:hypothetical protein
MGYKQILGHNRGFEDGATVSWDGFSVTGTGTSGLSTDDGCGSLRSGWIRASANTLAAFDVTKTARTDAVIAVPGGRYRASVCHKSITFYRSGSAVGKYNSAFVEFYNSTGGLITSSDIIVSNNTVTDWATYTLDNITAPATAATAKIAATVRVAKPDTDPAQSGDVKAGIDNFSLEQYLDTGGAVDLSGYGIA